MIVMKKDMYKFTLRFDKDDVEHQKVVEILNKQGKKKSRFIVSAVLNYTSDNKESIDNNKLEGLVRLIVDNVLHKESSMDAINKNDNSILNDSLKMFEI